MKQQSTSKGFAVLSAAGMLVKILSLLYIPFLLRIITGVGWGYYSAAYQIYVFIYVLTNSGIPVSISKLISELTAVKNYKDAVKSFKLARFLLLILGTVMTVLMLALAYPITKVMHYEKSYYSVIALAPAILFTSVSSAYRGYFQGRGNMTPTAISQIIEQVINTIFTLVFAALLMKYGVVYGCAGGTIGTTLGALFSASYLIIFYEKNKKFKIPKGISHEGDVRYTTKQLLMKIINYGVPITICVGMTYGGNLVDVMNTKSRLLATGLFSSDTATALYGNLVKYQQLLNVPIAIISALAAAILPAIAGAAIVKNKVEVKNKIDYALRLCLLIAVPAAIGLAVLSGPIFTLIFGHGYTDGAQLMKLGSAVLVLMSIVQIQTSILQGMGKLYTATLYSFLGIVVKITANYFLISVPWININGAVFGTLIGFALPLLLNQIMINKSLSIKVSLPEHAIKPLIASAFMGLMVFLANKYSFMLLSHFNKGYISNALATIISVIVGVYIYAYGLILTGGITSQDLETMPSKLIRLIPKKMLSRVR